MRQYLANKMRGMPLYHFGWFEDTKHNLIAQGYEVVSPHDIDISTHAVDIESHLTDGPVGFKRVFTKVELKPGITLDELLRRDFVALLTLCDTIVLGPDWQTSEGACWEGMLAARVGMPMYETDDGHALKRVNYPTTLFQEKLDTMRVARNRVYV